MYEFRYTYANKKHCSIYDMSYIKERNIKYQFIDMKGKGLSEGEYNSVKQATVGYKPEIWKEWK